MISLISLPKMQDVAVPPHNRNQAHSMNDDRAMASELLEICVRGKYYLVPNIDVNGKHIIVGGKVIRVASIHAEEWLEAEIDDPEECVRRLRQTHASELKADVF